MKKLRRLAGFSLVELLVVVAVLAILVSLLLPSLGKARNAAMDLKCLGAGLRAHGLALLVYAADNKSYFIPFPVQTNEFLFTHNAASQWSNTPPFDGPNTPLWSGQYLQRTEARKIQCPGYNTYKDQPLLGTPWDSHRQSSYLYLADIRHDAFYPGKNYVFTNGSSSGGDRNPWSWGQMWMRYNHMSGVEKEWLKSIYFIGGPNPSTSVLFADFTAYDGSTWDWSSGNVYWVNHSVSGRFFPNPNPMSAPAADANGYASLARVCRSAGSVYSDGHAILRYAKPNPTAINSLPILTPDNGSPDNREMLLNYAMWPYAWSNVWYYYW